MNKTLPTAAKMERATLQRDASYDGVFFVCVKTTGIFCRPSCPARKPRRRNMAYHATVRDCLLSGYRPCKRCRPLATNGQAPEWLDVLIRTVERSPSARLSDSSLCDMGISPHRARRYFSRNFGMTFQAYARARRMGIALEHLRRGGDSLSVGMGQGYESHSGFRDAFERTFGTTPGRSQAVVCIKTKTIESPVGPLVAGATADGVCLLEFADRRALQRQVATVGERLGGTVVPGSNKHLDRLAVELAEYFEHRRKHFTIPLVTAGTAFQEDVWRELQRIPYGETRSYDRIARQVGRPGAQRAVGRANGDNRIAIVIPCHRVVRSTGEMGGYGGGLWRKKLLLDLERTAPSDGGPREPLVNAAVS